MVGMQPFGGARGSGTNDKAGGPLNLLRWISPRTIKETFSPGAQLRVPLHGRRSRREADTPRAPASAHATLRRMTLLGSSPESCARSSSLCVCAGRGLVVRRDRPPHRPVPQRGQKPPAEPGPMLEQGTVVFDTPDLSLALVRSSQTVSAIKTKGLEAFDFTPGDLLIERSPRRLLPPRRPRLARPRRRRRRLDRLLHRGRARPGDATAPLAGRPRGGRPRADAGRRPAAEASRGRGAWSAVRSCSGSR